MTGCLHIPSVARTLPLVLFLASCLPEDGRPPPGRLVVTASSEPGNPPHHTADGWEIQIDRFLVSLGVHLELGRAEDDCDPYTVANYTRIVDLLRGSPQTVVTQHGLGVCGLGFQLTPPENDVVVGADIEEADVARMRTRAGDAFVESSTVALDVAGRGVRAGETLRFEWSFRQRFGYSGCATVDFQPGVPRNIDLRFETSALFRIEPEDDAPLTFDPYAEADANGDGEITLDELDAVTLPSGHTLAHRLYLVLVPSSPKVGGETCFDGAL